MQGQATIAIEHNFETAHRLPFLGGKCENLHGHSWRAKFHLVRVGLTGGVDQYGISLEFAAVKKIIRQWIDMYLDHGTMLGIDDDIVKYDCDHYLGKVFYFGDLPDEAPVDVEVYRNRPWPTVESVAEMLCFKIQEQLNIADGNDIWIVGVEVQETATNFATFTQAVPYNQDAEVKNG